MEHRKKIEAKHYDRLAKEWSRHHLHERGNADVEALNHRAFSSYRFCEKWITKHVKKGYTLLDYGCGNGIHSVLPATLGAKVIGIDLSEESLKIARRLAQEKNVQKLTIFLKMDCEKLSFPDNSFDVIFDGGTFSSLDLKKAIPELARVLKPTGKLIAIETLGHNPLTNLKRRLNNIRGIRTSWVVDHIFKIGDLDIMKNYFGNIETHFFNLLSLFAFPLLTITGGARLLHILEKVDLLLLRIPSLQKYAFKIVLVTSNKKHGNSQAKGTKSL